MATVTLTLTDQPDGSIAIRLESEPRLRLEALTPAQRLATVMLSTPEATEALWAAPPGNTTP